MHTYPYKIVYLRHVSLPFTKKKQKNSFTLFRMTLTLQKGIISH